jgi:hypothetical protein
MGTVGLLMDQTGVVHSSLAGPGAALFTPCEGGLHSQNAALLLARSQRSQVWLEHVAHSRSVRPGSPADAAKLGPARGGRRVLSNTSDRRNPKRVDAEDWQELAAQRAIEIRVAGPR